MTPASSSSPPGRDEWQDKFSLLLVRSGGMCEGRTPDCLAPAGRIEGNLGRRQISIQHRRARGMGGTRHQEAHSLANLLLLCGTGTTGCHGWVETKERGEALARGLWVEHAYRDDVPIPVEEYPLTLWSGRRVFLDPVHPLYVSHPDPYGVAGGPATKPNVTTIES